MTSELVAIDGATCTQDDAHVPPAGGGTYTISPITLQSFVYANNLLFIPNGQTYAAHGTAECVSSTTLLYVNGDAVCRDGDSISHHHNTYGVDVENQNFVRSD